MREGVLVALDGGKPMRLQPGGWADRVLGFSLVYRSLIGGTPTAVSDEAPEGNVVYGIESDTRGFPSWVTTMELLIQIRKAVEVYRVPFVVLIATTKPEIVPSPKGYTFRTLQQNFRLFLQTREIPYIDPLDGLLESHEAGRTPYYDKDHHWNKVGHEVAAASVESYFVEHCGELGLPLEKCAAKPRAAHRPLR